MASREELENAGFLDKEVEELLAGGIERIADPPYLTEMIKERQEAYVYAGELGLTDEEWAEEIREIYSQFGWDTAWNMFRDYEDRYKKRHPEYSPDYVWKRKKPPKSPELFDSLYEAGKTKYPRGAAYR